MRDRFFRNRVSGAEKFRCTQWRHYVRRPLPPDPIALSTLMRRRSDQLPCAIARSARPLTSALRVPSGPSRL
jgi:hypothetical protein